MAMPSPIPEVDPVTRATFPLHFDASLANDLEESALEAQATTSGLTRARHRVQDLSILGQAGRPPATNNKWLARALSNYTKS